MPVLCIFLCFKENENLIKNVYNLAYRLKHIASSSTKHVKVYSLQLICCWLYYTSTSWSFNFFLLLFFQKYILYFTFIYFILIQYNKCHAHHFAFPVHHLPPSRQLLLSPLGRNIIMCYSYIVSYSCAKRLACILAKIK